MRILQILQYPGDGGAEQYAYLLAKEARKTGDEVSFLFGGDGPFIERAKRLGADIGFLEMRFPGDPLAVLKLSGYLKKNRIDVVQTHFMRENFIAVMAAKLAKVRAVFTTVHRLEPKSSIQAFLNKTFSAGVSKMIAVSPLAREYLLEEGVSGQKIEIVPIGVDLEETDPAGTRGKFGLRQSDFVICCVGRFSPEKGQGVLLEAVAKLDDPRARLIFVGDGPTLAATKKRANELRLGDRVIFAGRLNDGYKVTAASNLYVQPSSIENLPISVIEAMILGVPVIASDNDAHLSMLKNGALGNLFKNGSSESLRERLAMVIGDYEDALRKAANARERAADEYTSAKMWRHTRALYASALGLTGREFDRPEPMVEKERVPVP